MSTERKLLRAILKMEAEANQNELDLSKVMSSVGISPAALREQLTKLVRKGYVTAEWRTTPAGQRVATRPLGQVLLRRQPTARQPMARQPTAQQPTVRQPTVRQPEVREAEGRRQPQEVFSRSTKIPLPIIDTGVLRASRNTSAPVANANWLPPTMTDGWQQSPAPRPPSVEHESFVDVRESELEELKPHY